jgi:two-component system NtrC family response regulator
VRDAINLQKFKGGLTVPRPTLLIIEDREPIAPIIRSAVGESCDLVVAGDRRTAMEQIQVSAPSVIVVSIDAPLAENYESGLRLLQDFRPLQGRLKTVVCLSGSERQLAPKLSQLGVFDVILKPIDADVLQGVLRRAVWMAGLEGEACQKQTGAPTYAMAGMVGTSPNMARIFDAIRKISSTDVPLLITGEDGTGKELTARAIHEHSRRLAGPFITMNCDAIAGNVLEAELFGTEPGSQIGAAESRGGKLQEAHGGTLFLDDVGELPPALQIKLLRVLQERALERVGSRRPIETDVRIIGATKTDLKEAVRQGKFREDLYYRLAVAHIHLPPLRERGGDILLLATTFLREAAMHHRKPIQGFTRAAMEALRTHNWPRNVRELSNSVWRGVVMADGTHVTPVDLDLASEREAHGYASISLKVNQQRIETDLILKAFTLSHGNLSRAAQELGISRSTLYRRLRQYGMDRTPDSLRMSTSSERAVTSDL